MKIQYCSDIHLELEENLDLYSKTPVIVPEGDILIILGDLLEIFDGIFSLSLFDRLSKDFKLVFWIPGNHEYRYGFDIQNIENLNYMYAVRHNVFLLNNQVVIVEDVKFVFSTLWSKVDKFKLDIESEVPDYSQNIYKGKILTVEDTNLFHKNSIKFLEQNGISTSNHKTVVCTHYAPSKKCNSAIYEGHKLNEAFYSELDSLILSSNIDFWLYGHTPLQLSRLQNW